MKTFSLLVPRVDKGRLNLNLLDAYKSQLPLQQWGERCVCVRSGESASGNLVLTRKWGIKAQQNSLEEEKCFRLYIKCKTMGEGKKEG